MYGWAYLFKDQLLKVWLLSDVTMLLIYMCMLHVVDFVLQMTGYDEPGCHSHNLLI